MTPDRLHKEARKEVAYPKLSPLARIVAKEVGWFKGWCPSEKAFKESCERAAVRVAQRVQGRLIRGVAKKFPCPGGHSILVKCMNERVQEKILSLTKRTNKRRGK
jgi:hypothetical protein